MSEEVTAAVTDAAAITDGSELYGFTALINNGTLITYVVLGLLVLMSLVSWYITFTKYWDQYQLNKAVKNVEKNFWAAGSVREGVERLPKDDDFRVIAESAIRAAAHHDGRLGERISLKEWLGMALNRSVDGLNSKLSGGLSFLATVGSTAPFVGLFGTVYGILEALLTIGITGQPSIDKVAGPVGEALIMTAIGLAVAVPAVFAYNILLKRNKAIQDVLREFTGDLEANLIGGVKPDLPVARTAAAPAAKK
jgi:biopolymer transport protein ExbB